MGGTEFDVDIVGLNIAIDRWRLTAGTGSWKSALARAAGISRATLWRFLIDGQPVEAPTATSVLRVLGLEPTDVLRPVTTFATLDELQAAGQAVVDATAELAARLDRLTDILRRVPPTSGTS